MKYQFFPGCSLLTSAKDFYQSIQAIAPELKLELMEIPDWNCCGATVTSSLDYLSAQLMPARNLALASQREGDVVAACNSCYLTLAKANENLSSYPELQHKVNHLLEEVGLKMARKVKVKHLIEILWREVGIQKIKDLVKKPLTGLKVIPYYGCQIVKPTSFDEAENPQSMDQILSALGCDVQEFYQKSRCCGGALITIQPELALKLIQEILAEAQERQADLIATTCPLCQMNLDAYQDKINRKYKRNYHIPVVYFTQLMGLAFGKDSQSLGLERGLVSVKPILSKIS